MNPENAHKKKDAGRFVRIIIFFIKTASLPEKIKAKNLYKNADLLIFFPNLTIKQVPKRIKPIPSKSAASGVSPRHKNDINRATIGLYEFIGASAESSPIESAFII